MSPDQSSSGDGSGSEAALYRSFMNALPPEQIFIDGAFVDASAEKRLSLTNPANEEVFAQAASATIGDVEKAVDGAERAFKQGWRDLTPGKRTETLFAVS